MAVYDCFSFYNELQLLGIRLESLYPYVDKFVLVELPRTHRGDEKRLYFKENIDQFKKYLDKIIYICPEYVPAYRGDGDWIIENYQRNCILKGIADCKPDDIIMVSDLDEIPRPDILKFTGQFSFKPCYLSKRDRVRSWGYYFSLLSDDFVSSILKNKKATVLDLLEYTPVSCEQDLYYYYLNCKSQSRWHGTVIAKFRNMPSPQLMRNMSGILPTIKDGGWHFSYLGGMDRIKSKLSAIIDSDSGIINKMKRYSNDDDYIISCMENGLDIYGRKGNIGKFQFVDYEKIGFPNIKKVIDRFPEFYKSPDNQRREK